MTWQHDTTTNVPPGNCLMHGYHGQQVCPKCHTAAIPLQVNTGWNPSAPIRDEAWICPRCGAVYGPMAVECYRCNAKLTKEDKP